MKPHYELPKAHGTDGAALKGTLTVPQPSLPPPVKTPERRSIEEYGSSAGERAALLFAVAAFLGIAVTCIRSDMVSTMEFGVPAGKKGPAARAEQEQGAKRGEKPKVPKAVSEILEQ